MKIIKYLRYLWGKILFTNNKIKQIFLRIIENTSRLITKTAKGLARIYIEPLINRTNSFLSVIYTAVGISLSYIALDKLYLGIILFFAFTIIDVPIISLSIKNKMILDAQKWTKTSSKSVLSLLIVLLLWVPQRIHLDRMASFTSLLYFGGLGFVLAGSLYFHDYISPVICGGNKETEVKVLEMEHRELLATLTYIIAACVVVVGTVFGTYVFNYVKVTDRLLGQYDNIIFIQLVAAMYITSGIFLWMLRPIHARCREIRIRIREIYED